MENQGKILDHIKKNPGHTQSQITYRLEIPQSTIKYHLLQLIKENKIFSEKLFKTHYFPVGIEHNEKRKHSIQHHWTYRRVACIYTKIDSISSSNNIGTKITANAMITAAPIIRCFNS